MAFRSIHEEMKKKNLQNRAPRVKAGQTVPGETRPALSLAHGALGHRRPPPNGPVFNMKTVFILNTGPFGGGLRCPRAPCARLSAGRVSPGTVCPAFTRGARFCRFFFFISSCIERKAIGVAKR